MSIRCRCGVNDLPCVPGSMMPASGMKAAPAGMAGLAGRGCGHVSRVNALSCHLRSIRWLINEVIAKIPMPRIEIRISAA